MNMQMRFVSFTFQLILVAVLCFALSNNLTAQGLKISDKTVVHESFSVLADQLHQKIPVLGIVSTPVKNYSIMLPDPGMEHDPPLFCRLEDKINAENKIQCLFRLGSVSYVNYLEQKGDHQRLMLEQLR